MNFSREKIINILQQVGVSYTIGPAKNVSAGNIGIKCPFCINDPSNHCGISEENGNFTCWKCRTSGPLIYLIKKLTGYTEEQCIKIIGEDHDLFKQDTMERILRMINNDDEPKTKKSNSVPMDFPQYFEPITPGTNFQLLNSYLERRRIGLETVIKYGCGICCVGKYMNRLIIPVLFEGHIVSFQAADLTGCAHLKYKSAQNINNYLYNYDSIQKNGRMIIVEGVLDCWRVDKDVVATFGTHVTDRQKQLILNKKPNELIFLWDEDAYFKVSPYYSVAGFFEPFIDKVRIVKLPEDKDPDDLSRDEIFKLING